VDKPCCIRSRDRMKETLHRASNSRPDQVALRARCLQPNAALYESDAGELDLSIPDRFELMVASQSDRLAQTRTAFRPGAMARMPPPPRPASPGGRSKKGKRAVHRGTCPPARPLAARPLRVAEAACAPWPSSPHRRCSRRARSPYSGSLPCRRTQTTPGSL
jgi:hypothetical protein